MTNDNELTQAESMIKSAMMQNGPFTHNLISMALRTLDNKEKANQLIEKYNLDKKYGIHPIFNK